MWCDHFMSYTKYLFVCYLFRPQAATTHIDTNIHTYIHTCKDVVYVWAHNLTEAQKQQTIWTIQSSSPQNNVLLQIESPQLVFRAVWELLWWSVNAQIKEKVYEKQIRTKSKGKENNSHNTHSISINSYGGLAEEMLSKRK